MTPQWQKELAEVLVGCGDTYKMQRILQGVNGLRDAANEVVPIVEAAFWDHHTAGTMPGSGYNHKVYSRVSEIFGWKDTKKFESWKKRITELVGETNAEINRR